MATFFFFPWEIHGHEYSSSLQTEQPNYYSFSLMIPKALKFISCLLNSPQRRRNQFQIGSFQESTLTWVSGPNPAVKEVTQGWALQHSSDAGIAFLMLQCWNGLIYHTVFHISLIYSCEWQVNSITQEHSCFPAHGSLPVLGWALI